MPKYIVEVPHSGDRLECQRSIQIFLSTGNHFLMNADWGCHDGVHKAWFMMEVDNKDEAMRVIPPLYRKDAIITQLEKFKPQDFDKIMRQH